MSDFKYPEVSFVNATREQLEAVARLAHDYGHALSGGFCPDTLELRTALILEVRAIAQAPEDVFKLKEGHYWADFRCPKCCSDQFSSGQNGDGTWTRHCSGLYHTRGYVPCDFKAHESLDHTCFTRQKPCSTHTSESP